MVAAFHVVAMAVATDIEEIVECEEDEKRETAAEINEGKRKKLILGHLTQPKPDLN